MSKDSDIRSLKREVESLATANSYLNNKLAEKAREETAVVAALAQRLQRAKTALHQFIDNI